jgi:SAM-dependent methyltransferase
VDARHHPRLERLLRAFQARTGTPLLVNTSFNLGWEPIVESPRDAWRTFLACGIDALVMQDVLLLKSEQRAVAESRRPAAGGRGEEDPALRALWCCPACGGELGDAGLAAACCGCGRSFPAEEGIWRFFHPHEAVEGDVTEAVKAFYEKTPFPNYDEHESLRSLIDKSRRGIYARLLNEQIPFNSRVLEVGCGTGQLSNFLGIGCRTVVGADLCLNSLRLAEGFRSRHGLSNVRFLQMNLFRPALRDEQFDVVLCNGVLHHTSDPAGGFERIARLVRPGGHVVIGLYNRWGRLALDARRVVFRASGGRMRWLDAHLRSTPMSREKQESWFNDQYRHPHESKHTMGEVLGWFDRHGFEFVNAVPKTRPWDTFSDAERLFEPAERGTHLDRALAQAKMVVTGSREGGFYIMIGRRTG